MLCELYRVYLNITYILSEYYLGNVFNRRPSLKEALLVYLALLPSRSEKEIY